MKKLAIGIDIGGTNSAFGVVDREGRIYGEGSIDTVDHFTVDYFIENLDSGIRKLLAGLDFEYTLEGIGIGAPNANYYTGTINNAPNLPWKGVIHFTEKMGKYFKDIPVVLTNDAKAAAVGEMVYGGARKMRDFIVITLGTGLGSGFVAGGELILGRDSLAGELGHTTAVPHGRRCGCGRCGCLETYVSASGIKRTVFELLADSREQSPLRDLSFSNMEAVTISQLAEKGDSLAAEAFDYTGKVLGRALANAVMITGPEAIFLFGGLAKAGKWIFEPTEKYMEEALHPNFKGKTKLLPSGVEGMNAAVLGAAALVFQLQITK